MKQKDGITIIPISKVKFGFAAGGSEFRGEAINEYTKKENEEEMRYRLPFGGGSGAGASITPVAFLIVEESQVKLLNIDHDSVIDKLLDYVPDAIGKISGILNKDKKCNEDYTFNDNMNK